MTTNETPTPRTDALGYIPTDIGHCWPLVEHARELERELATMTERWHNACLLGADEAFRANRLERELAEARKQLADWQVLQATTEQELSAERALADRLAECLETVLSGYDAAEEIAPINGHEAFVSTQALAAWKEVRNE